MNRFGHTQVERSDDPSNRVGIEYTHNGATKYAPRGLAEIVVRLSAGGARLTDAERGNADCAGIDTVTGADGTTRCVGSLGSVQWYGLPVAPKAPERPAPTTTLFRQPYKR